MTADMPIQLIAAAFKDEASAKVALNSLRQAQKERVIKIEDTAVPRNDEKGKWHIKETADMGGGKGAASAKSSVPQATAQLSKIHN